MVLLIIMLFISLTHAITLDQAANQLPRYKIKSSCPMNNLTTSAGAPVTKSDADSSLDDVSLFYNEYLRDTNSHFIAGRIPVRIVHAKGVGAFGYFELTRNITDICKAKLFSSIGKRTKVAVRFSPTLNEIGVRDTVRDIRGLSIRFYTEDGNFDIVALNSPMFFFKDPLLFIPRKRSSSKNPKTNLRDANSIWDYTTLHPEFLFTAIYMMSDRGIPLSYRHTPGFSVHTYQLINKNGVSFFVRFHFIPNQGIKNLYSDDAKRIGDRDGDSYTRDLYNAIEKGDFPSWTVSLQILTYDDVKNAPFDVFDLTRILPEELYPLVDIGQFVLNETVLNTFAEVEQMAFSPANLVPGVKGAPDEVFETRLLAYRNAHIYRIGPNFNKVPVNCPITTVSTYLRDGRGAGTNEEDHPNYRPNSFCGPMPQDYYNEPKILQISEGKPYNLDQVAKFIDDMSKGEQNRLVQNIVDSLEGANSSIQDKAINLITRVNSKIGKRIAEALYAKGN